MNFKKVFQSNYCKSVFLITFIGSYFLIPDTVFNGVYYVLAITFMTTFALTLTCLVRSIKEKVVSARTYKGSFLSFLATVLGFSALQVCGIGAPVCGASLRVGFLSVIFPKIVHDFFHEASVWIVGFSILFQLIGLYYMKCLTKNLKS